MPEETPYEKLKKANDDYHEAVGEILQDSSVDVAVRVHFAERVFHAFRCMQEADDIAKEAYTPEEE